MERIDDLQYRGLGILQDDSLYCFGCDAVELANFVTGRKGERACDLGCGNGVIPILLAAKLGMKVVGVELQSAAAALARRSVEMNGLESAEIVCGRMQDFAAKSENVGAFEVVTCNPPYRKVGSGEKQKNEAVALARHEIEVTLGEVAAAAARLLGSGGRFFTVCKTERLAEYIALCQSVRLTPKILQVLTPCEGKPPHLFLLKCVKDGKSGLSVLSQRAVRAYGIGE